MATDRVRGAGDLEHLASALFDSLQVGVAAFDASGRLVLANRALRTLYQLPAAGDPGHLTDLVTVEQLVRESLRDQHSPVDRALAGDTVDGADVQIVVPEGPPRHAEVNARPIRSADGRPLGAVAAFRDTTGRHRADRFRACELLVARALAEATTVADVGPALARAVAGSLGWPHTQLWLVDEVADVLRMAGHWDAPGRSLDGMLPATMARGWGIGGTVWSTGEPLWIPDLLHTDQVATADFAGRARRAAAAGVRAAVSVPIRDGHTVLGVLTCVADHPEYDGDRLVAQLGGIAGQIGHFLSRRRADELAQELRGARDDFRMLLRALDDPAEARAVRDDLRDLVALEDGVAGLDVRELDLAAVVSAAATTTALTSGASVHVGLPGRLLLQGDATRLRAVVDALLSAAVAGGNAGDVYVRLRDEPGVAELTVIGVGGPSDGGGAPPDGGLTRRRRLAGAVVRAHGGTVRTVQGYQPDVTFTVRLPIGGPPHRAIREPPIRRRWAPARPARS